MMPGPVPDSRAGFTAGGMGGEIEPVTIRNGDCGEP
jgi:hypothetical protein